MFKVATLVALPGVVGFAKYVIPKLQVPVPAARVTVPVPDCPLDGKLQLVPVVGAAKAKLAAFVPVMLCAVILSAAPPGLIIVIFAVGVVVLRFVGPRMIGDGVTKSTGLGFAVIVKANDVAGDGPPPGTGLVIVTVTGPAVVRSETGTGTLKPVPPPVTVPPVSGMLLNVTSVPATKLGAGPPLKFRVTGV